MDGGVEDGTEGWRRFAVYYAPRAESAIGRFGAAWLGRDLATGAALSPPPVADLPRPRAELTAAAERYGFHATLKAPFRLAEGATLPGLRGAVAALAAGAAPVRVPVRLGALGAFVAITPRRRMRELDRIASLCVRRLDGFRAALTAEETARRRPERLTPRQARRLAAWGYPFVFEDFRFHMTLTGPLPPAERAAAAAALRQAAGPALEDGLAVEDLCLCGEGADGRFRLLARLPLGAG